MKVNPFKLVYTCLDNHADNGYRCSWLQPFTSSSQLGNHA